MLRGVSYCKLDGSFRIHQSQKSKFQDIRLRYMRHECTDFFSIRMHGREFIWDFVDHELYG
jgi:hypothetical protein